MFRTLPTEVMPRLKKRYSTAIMALAVLFAAGLSGNLPYSRDGSDAPIRETALETGCGNYELQVFRNQVLIHKDGDLAAQTWKPDSGLKIIDALAARRQRGADSELLIITGPEDSPYGSCFEILGVSIDGTLQRRAIESMGGMNPWKLQTADVDGDGDQDISITMYKKTKFHPVMANRPFLYFWKEGRIEPLWRGSRLSRPFDDYVFADLNSDGCDELIAAEHLQNGGQVLQAYGWRGFGFEGLAQSVPLDKISSLQVNPDTGDVKVLVETLGSAALYTADFKDGKLQLLIEK